MNEEVIDKILEDLSDVKEQLARMDERWKRIEKFLFNGAEGGFEKRLRNLEGDVTTLKKTLFDETTGLVKTVATLTTESWMSKGASKRSVMLWSIVQWFLTLLLGGGVIWIILKIKQL